MNKPKVRWKHTNNPDCKMQYSYNKDIDDDNLDDI